MDERKQLSTWELLRFLQQESVLPRGLIIAMTIRASTVLFTIRRGVLSVAVRRAADFWLPSKAGANALRLIKSAATH